MSWGISPRIADILDRGDDSADIDRDAAISLMRLDLSSKETYALMQTANRLSREQFNGKGENHLHKPSR